MNPKKTKPEETRDVFEGADLDPSGFEAMTSEEIALEESEISKNSEILENSKTQKPHRFKTRHSAKVGQAFQNRQLLKIKEARRIVEEVNRPRIIQKQKAK